MVLAHIREGNTLQTPALSTPQPCAENNTPEREGMSQEEPDLLGTLQNQLGPSWEEEHVSRLFGATIILCFCLRSLIHIVNNLEPIPLHCRIIFKFNK